MSALVWQSWPRITMKESQKLLSYFNTHGNVLVFKSTRKYMLGPIGQGIVVFDKPEAVQKILEGQEDRRLDLSSLFVPKSADATATTTSESPVADAQEQDWTVSVSLRPKTALQIHLESSLIRTKNSLKKEFQFFDEAVEQFPESIKPLLASRFSDIKEDFREVERIRGATKKSRREKKSNAVDQASGTEISQQSTTDVKSEASMS